ncbi:MAG: exodeoxyribonuclease VII small subunit [Dorea sp.]|nr:exodeoxyribonuclease VII small subunit [Dorea sp.]
MDENKKQADLKLEELFSSLDDIIRKMEDDSISLEDSFQYYYKGMELLKNCNEKIDQVEKQIQMIDDRGELHEF